MNPTNKTYTDAAALVHAAVENGYKAAPPWWDLGPASKGPMEALLGLDPKHALYKAVIKELARTLNALDKNERFDFATEAFDTGVIPTELHWALHRFVPSGEIVVELPTGYQVLIALNPYTDTETLAALITVEDPGAVYAAARRLIEKAHRGPFPFELMEHFRDDLAVAVERWRSFPQVFGVLKRLERLPWDRPVTYDVRTAFYTAHDEYQRLLVEAFLEATEALGPEAQEDARESQRRGGFAWGLTVLFNFGPKAREAFTDSLAKRLKALDDHAKKVFARVYGDIERLRPALLKAGL